MPCQCENDRAACRCTITAGLNVTIDGSGIAADPIVIHVSPQYLEGVNGADTIVTVSGTGDIENPFILRVDVDPALVEGWTMWQGSRSELTALGTIPESTLAVVIPGA